MSDAKTPAGLIAEYVKSAIAKLPVEIQSEVQKQFDALEVPKGDQGETGLGFNTKSWEPAIYRADEIVQHNIGQCFKALVDTNTEPGMSDDWERVGTNGLRWTGLKQADFNYVDGDMFIDGGSLFLHMDGKTKMLVQRGKNGRDGRDGADGKDGVDQAQIVAGVLDVIDKALILAKDDGTTTEVEVRGLEGMQKALLWIEQQWAIEEDIGISFRQYKGIYKRGESYSKGDCVNFNKGLYIANENDSNSVILDADKWIKIAGSGGGGGGGGADAATIMTNVANLYVPKTSFVNSSAGAPNAGQVPTLDPNGKLDGSFLAIPGGMTLKGSVDPTVAAVTTPKAGDYYIIGSDGTLDASYGLGALAAKKGDTILYSGTAWVHNESKIDLSTVYTKSQVDTKLAAFTGGLVFLKITAAAYNALPVKDPKTLYLVSG